MRPKNNVFIATSLDGYIAKKDGNIDWLHSCPDPDNPDMGYDAFMEGIDALVMGRNTFETVCGFDMEWPYRQPVFVISQTMTTIPSAFRDKAELVRGSLPSILETIQSKGYHNLYVDGGKTIQSFLREDLIDEMTITIIPILLGGGISLFGDLPDMLHFECKRTRLFNGGAVQHTFTRKK